MATIDAQRPAPRSPAARRAVDPAVAQREARAWLASLDVRNTTPGEGVDGEYTRLVVIPDGDNTRFVDVHRVTDAGRSASTANRSVTMDVRDATLDPSDSIVVMKVARLVVSCETGAVVVDQLQPYRTAPDLRIERTLLPKVTVDGQSLAVLATMVAHACPQGVVAKAPPAPEPSASAPRAEPPRSSSPAAPRAGNPAPATSRASNPASAKGSAPGGARAKAPANTPGRQFHVRMLQDQYRVDERLASAIRDRRAQVFGDSIVAAVEAAALERDGTSRAQGECRLRADRPYEAVDAWSIKLPQCVRWSVGRSAIIYDFETMAAATYDPQRATEMYRALVEELAQTEEEADARMKALVSGPIGRALLLVMSFVAQNVTDSRAGVEEWRWEGSGGLYPEAPVASALGSLAYAQGNDTLFAVAVLLRSDKQGRMSFPAIESAVTEFQGLVAKHGLATVVQRSRELRLKSSLSGWGYPWRGLFGRWLHVEEDRSEIRDLFLQKFPNE